MASGVSLQLYTTKQELDNIKNGVSTIVAWAPGKEPDEAIYGISVSIEICDVLDGEVRVNVSRAGDEIKKMGEIVGAAIAAELDKVFKQFSE